MIGEIGIDYKFATTDEQKERQLVLLNKQLELAEKLKLPINLHSRRFVLIPPFIFLKYIIIFIFFILIKIPFPYFNVYISAERQTMRVGIEYHNKTGNNAVLHWFTHSRKLVKQATKGGVFVSVGPSVIS